MWKILSGGQISFVMTTAKLNHFRPPLVIGDCIDKMAALFLLKSTLFFSREWDVKALFGARLHLNKSPRHASVPTLNTFFSKLPQHANASQDKAFSVLFIEITWKCHHSHITIETRERLDGNIRLINPPLRKGIIFFSSIGFFFFYLFLFFIPVCFSTDEQCWLGFLEGYSSIFCSQMVIIY